MAQHGYARDYDENFDRGHDRERAWRERYWQERDWRDRERGFMFGRDIRGDYGPQQDYAGSRGEWDEGPRSFSIRPDDHYRSWRQKQIDALDRDFADYCREREQQFHQDFDSWRRQRQGNQPLGPGMTQSGLSSDQTGTLELTSEITSDAQNKQEPVATATLGTTSSGRGKR